EASSSIGKRTIAQGGEGTSIAPAWTGWPQGIDAIGVARNSAPPLDDRWRLRSHDPARPQHAERRTRWVGRPEPRAARVPWPRHAERSTQWVGRPEPREARLTVTPTRREEHTMGWKA